MSIALLAGSLAACSNGEASEPAETVESVPLEKEYVVNIKIETISPAAITDRLMLPGETEAMHDVSLAAEHEGVIEWVGVTEGDVVIADEQLVRIDLTALDAVRDRARASLAMKKQQLERRKKLYKGNVLSREELDLAENEFTVAETSVREAEVNYLHGIVSTPVAGVVNKVHVDPGEFVSSGAAIADIVER